MIPLHLINRIEQSDRLTTAEKELLIERIIAEQNQGKYNAYPNSDAGYLHSYIIWNKSRFGFAYWQKMSCKMDGNTNVITPQLTNLNDKKDEEEETLSEDCYCGA